MEDIFDTTGLEHQHVSERELHLLEEEFDPPHFVARELVRIAKELVGYVDESAWGVMRNLMAGIADDAEAASELTEKAASSVLHLELQRPAAAKKALYLLGQLDGKLEELEKETQSYRKVVQGIADNVEVEGGSQFGIHGSTNDDSV